MIDYLLQKLSSLIILNTLKLNHQYQIQKYFYSLQLYLQTQLPYMTTKENLSQ